MAKEAEAIPDRVIDRLRKLLAHKLSAEAIGSKEEAAAFADKLNELLLRHNVDLASIEITEDDSKRAIDRTRVIVGKLKERREPWMEDLASIVARAHLCRILIVSRRSSLFFVGTETNREVAVYVFEQLANAAMRLANAELGKAIAAKRRSADRFWKLRDLVYSQRSSRIEDAEFESLRRGRDLQGFKRGFYRGFTLAVSVKLDARQRQAEASSESTALILRTALDRVDGWITENVKRRARSLTDQPGSSAGYDAGRRHGSAIEIMKGVGTSVGPRAIEAGKL